MIMMIRGQKNSKDSSLQEVGKLLIVFMPNFKELYRVVVAEHCTPKVKNWELFIFF